MKIFRIFLIYQFIIFQTVRADLTAIPESLVIHVPSERDEIIPVNLVPVETFLANENVPVWVPKPEHPTRLISKPYVIKVLGPFTMYWDIANNAAAVYYHERNEINAIIGHHRVIRKLSYNPTTKEVEHTEQTVSFSTMDKHNNIRLTRKESPVIEDDDAYVERIQSRMKYPKEVYIETLVIVNYDITKELNFNHAEVVSYVLTIFNMVDMLYWKIEKPKIRINIAGIIIATGLLTFSKALFKCYHENTGRPGRYKMDADCSLSVIYDTLRHYENLPFQSYDVVVFITRHDLFRWSTETSETRGVRYQVKRMIWGLADTNRQTSDYRLASSGTGISIAGDPDIYAIFPTIAHEMAHFFDVPHEGGPLWKEDGTCDAHLLKNDDSYCNKCIQFGGKTPEQLKKFFGTRPGCIFRNKPSSFINPQGPREFLTEDEQCRCYGHLWAYRPVNGFQASQCLPIGGTIPNAVDCQSRLECISRSHEKRRTGIVMNGTPCDGEKHSKVCWNSECLPALKDPQLESDV